MKTYRAVFDCPSAPQNCVILEWDREYFSSRDWKSLISSVLSPRLLDWQHCSRLTITLYRDTEAFAIINVDYHEHMDGSTSKTMYFADSLLVIRKSSNKEEI